MTERSRLGRQIAIVWLLLIGSAAEFTLANDVLSPAQLGCPSRPEANNVSFVVAECKEPKPNSVKFGRTLREACVPRGNAEGMEKPQQLQHPSKSPTDKSAPN